MMRRRDKANEKLPPYVYLKKGRYVRVTYDPSTRKQKERVFCPGSLSVSEVWALYEGGSGDNLAAIADQFEDSPTWALLSPLTQKDYERCHKAVCSYPTRTGPLGAVSLTEWTPGLVRQLIDKRGQHSVARANHELRWLKRIFAWAYERDLIDRNPAKGVSLLKQPPRQRYVEHTEYAEAIKRAQRSKAPYLAPMMEFAYRCRMRLCEVLDVTDADLTDEGIRVRRRKGSKGNITEWSPQLRAAVSVAKERRQKIVKKRGMLPQINPERRYLFVARDGGRMTESTVQSAWQRLMKDWPQRFTFHDLKRKGVSDTKGDKLKASGHRSVAMLGVYDVRPDVVAPADES